MYQGCLLSDGMGWAIPPGTDVSDRPYAHLAMIDGILLLVSPA